MITKLLLIAGGGAIGAVLRFGVTEGVHTMLGEKSAWATLPTGTLTVNVLGCLLIGVIGAALAGPHEPHEGFRMFIVVGLLGAFTTFSTFGWESVALWNISPGRAAAYIVASNVLGIAAVFGGYRATIAIVGDASSAM